MAAAGCYCTVLHRSPFSQVTGRGRRKQTESNRIALASYRLQSTERQTHLQKK